VASGGGYPTCRQWWLDGGDGLRDRLLAQVDPGLLSRFAQWAGFLSAGEVDDSVIRADRLAEAAEVMNQGARLHRLRRPDRHDAAQRRRPAPRRTCGLTFGSLGFFPAMDVVRQALAHGAVVA
jgi:hypothetical protein